MVAFALLVTVAAVLLAMSGRLGRSHLPEAWGADRGRPPPFATGLLVARLAAGAVFGAALWFLLEALGIVAD